MILLLHTPIYVMHVNMQAMDQFELDNFRYGGVNITGFRLLRDTGERLRAFRQEWLKLNPTQWPGAGERITVSYIKRSIEFALAYFAIHSY